MRDISSGPASGFLVDELDTSQQPELVFLNVGIEWSEAASSFEACLPHSFEFHILFSYQPCRNCL